MLILSFESSAKSASVALTDDGELVGEYTLCTALTHSRTLLPMAENLLKNTEISMNDIDLFACAYGPGSFTGIRIGVATVKGLAWALNKPCVGVSTLEAMSWHGVSSQEIICPVMDARRSQVYNALFQIKNGKPERIREDRAISTDELISDIRSLTDNPVFLVGDGMKVAQNAFTKAGIPFTAAPGNLAYQTAWGVAMAAGDKVPGTADDLLPVYLRLSQAERERNERLAKEQAEAAEETK
ncbi:MAG: tRNA (adenosine(37)-N6)-threonylcarbamoyltransferase complex dimerization subunit type 1 TsaB [Eubacteriales bacterium]|nr:tRNA (adenosine(37)-N6)-threonylcarbamoyltransferase complex dimerization subunit type 1 TsaB [Eubacteriales bacterium]